MLYATNRARLGFTIVELLIVIVVIAILAAIIIVSYNGITRRTNESSLLSDLRNGAVQLNVAKETNGAYPADDSSIKRSSNTTFRYIGAPERFCLEATSTALPGTMYYVAQDGVITSGGCPIVDMQLISKATCSYSRSAVKDARDNHTYWVQRIADGNCWMLTNLGYAGGGTNTYGDVKTVNNGTGGAVSYTAPNYYIVPSTVNFTVAPSLPSESTNGTGQYGHLYNWCAAMGGQATSACTDTAASPPDTTVSICPAGWRLPTGGSSSGELFSLNGAVNSGASNTDGGLLLNWLGQRAGSWSTGFTNQGTHGRYWSSTQYSNTNAGYMVYSSASTGFPGIAKYTGYSVRCVAD